MTTAVRNESYTYNLGIQLDLAPRNWNIESGAAVASSGHFLTILPQLKFGVTVYPFEDFIEATDDKNPCPTVSIRATGVDSDLEFDVKVSVKWGDDDSETKSQQKTLKTNKPLVCRFGKFEDYEGEFLIVSVFITSKLPWDFGLDSDENANSNATKDNQAPSGTHPTSLRFTTADADPFSFTVSIETVKKLKSPILNELLSSSTDGTIPEYILTECSYAAAKVFKEAINRGNFQNPNVCLLSQLGKEIYSTLDELEMKSAMTELIVETLKTLKFPHFFPIVEALLKFSFSHEIPGLTGILVQHFVDKFAANTCMMKKLGPKIARAIEIMKDGEKAFEHCLVDPKKIGVFYE